MFALALALVLAPEDLSAGEIMSRVADNQQRALEARARYVYRQDVSGRLLRGGGKVAREEKRVYTVAPTPDGTQKELNSLQGRYEKGGKYYDYTEKGFQYKDTDIDGDLLDDLIDELVDDKGSRDGIDHDLFPLRREKIGNYDFKLLESKDFRGRRVHRIEFQPKDKSDFGWKGEALIDADEFEPVSIYTKLSRGIPAAVKILLGTDVKQLGFSIEYARVAPGVWFPASYGSEFHLRAVFFYARTITLSTKNSDFRITGAESTITYKDPEP